MKGKDKWIGLRAAHEWPDISALMDLMLLFRSRLYVCTASAEHLVINEHGQGPKYDQEANNVRDLARQKGIMAWTGQAFWDILKTYRQPWNPYHHGEPGNWCNITYLWDKFLFHIYLFCICNMASRSSLHGYDRL
eukprot:7860065-Heterocapsa_arctica.AAC.1